MSCRFGPFYERLATLIEELKMQASPGGTKNTIAYFEAWRTKCSLEWQSLGKAPLVIAAACPACRGERGWKRAGTGCATREMGPWNRGERCNSGETERQCASAVAVRLIGGGAAGDVEGRLPAVVKALWQSSNEAKEPQEAPKPTITGELDSLQAITAEGGAGPFEFCAGGWTPKGDTGLEHLTLCIPTRIP